jgi:hypothetical protein
MILNWMIYNGWWGRGGRKRVHKLIFDFFYTKTCLFTIILNSNTPTLAKKEEDNPSHGLVSHSSDMHESTSCYYAD